MYTLTHIDPARPPRATRHLNKRVLCGMCSYRCCNSPALVVECTPAESKALRLPVVFPQEGRCRCLTPTGCTHGPARPVFCQLFPLQVNKYNNLVISNWANLQCPRDCDYELDVVGLRDRKWQYRLKIQKGPRVGNSHRILLLDQPIEKYPTVFENAKAAIVAIWGAAGYQKIATELAALNQKRPGLGLL